MSSPKSLVLVDGSGFIFRAYHAIRPLTSPAGVPVNAVYGFTTMVMKLLEEHTSDYLAVVFDAGRRTFRNDIYPDYKAHRPPPPDDLVPQFALTRDAARALSLPVVELPGYEADDVIATYARQAKERGLQVTIVSSDKDLMQLICEGIGMYDPMKQKMLGDAEVREKFGVGPCEVREVLALIGDSSDNVPGVPGIGPKTAAELINQYKTLENLLAHTSEIKQQKRRETLESNAEQARLSWKLIGLDEQTPVPVPLDELIVPAPDKSKLMHFLQEHGFKSLAAKIGKAGEQLTVDSGQSPTPTVHRPPSTAVYELVQDEAALIRWIEDAYRTGRIAVDTETTGLDAMRAELVGISLSTGGGKACYIPLAHQLAVSSLQHAEEGGPLFSTANCQLPTANLKQVPLARALELLRPLLSNKHVLKIGHNLKYDMLLLKRYGIEIAPIDDSMLLSYVLNAGAHPHNMDELAERYLQHKTITYDEVTGTGRARVSFAEVPLERARDYAAEDADITWRLWEYAKEQVIEQGLLSVYETEERALVPVLVAMEARGVRVDLTTLSELSRDFESRMRMIEEEIYQHAGHSFNIASPKQLGDILFDELKLPGGRKSGKTGAYVTDAETLEELVAYGHPLPKCVLAWRQLAKLKSTYTDALATQINPDTGRVHTSYAMAIASTGRLSSTDPNLQNIPIRTEEGRKIRRAFIAAPGHTLISADYSQIELRLLAHMADIATLKDAFAHGRDIHAITASQMFGVSPDAVSGELRRRAKTINFGIIYGISAHGLATRLGIGRGEAAQYIDQYFRQYPGIRDYMENAKEEARKFGYVTTLYGRRIHIPGIRESNGARRQFGERQAINAPLQGTAADIIKRAMIAVEESLTGTSARMLLQVHDELVFECLPDDATAHMARIKHIMEHAAQLSVPLTVEVNAGGNWGEVH